MSKFLKVMVVLLTCSVLFACSTTPFVPPVACEGADSFILKTIPDVKAFDKGLLAVNVGTLELSKGYTPGDAIKVLDRIENLVDKADITYAELVGLVSQKLEIANALAGAAIFIVGDDIQKLNRKLPISDCDKELIRIHLERQRAVVNIYKGATSMWFGIDLDEILTSAAAETDRRLAGWSGV